MANDKKAPVCAVVGVGPGNGEAFARRFSADGYAVALMARRPELTQSSRANCRAPAPTPATSPTKLRSRRRSPKTRAELGEIDVLIFNAGSGVWGNVEEVKAGGSRARVAGQYARPVSDRPRRSFPR